MALETLLARLESKNVTPATASRNSSVADNTLTNIVCTPVTPVTDEDVATPGFSHSGNPAVWAIDDWQEFYDERAGVAEYEGKQSREKAERMAYESCITRWLDTHPPAHTDDTICPHCQQPNGTPGTSCIPALSGNGGHVWLHRACHEPWRAQRRQEAVKALADIGII